MISKIVVILHGTWYDFFRPKEEHILYYRDGRYHCSCGFLNNGKTWDDHD